MAGRQYREPAPHVVEDGDDPRYWRARRVCLSCGETFGSSWIGNRVCSGCKNRRNRSALPESRESLIPAGRVKRAPGA